MEVTLESKSNSYEGTDWTFFGGARGTDTYHEGGERYQTQRIDRLQPGMRFSALNGVYDV